MKHGTIGALLCAALLLLAACGDDGGGTPLDGGNCEYLDHLGTITIVSTDPATPGGNNCRDAVEVIFDFEPAGTAGYVFPQWPDEGNTITVGEKDDLRAIGCSGAEANWLAEPSNAWIRCTTKIRYNARPVPARCVARPGCAGWHR